MCKTDFTLSKENFTPIALPSVESIVKKLKQKRDFEKGCILGSKEFEAYRNITFIEIQ